jgi:DNA uptake protein ComE-like DNA-binding protein
LLVYANVAERRRGGLFKDIKDLERVRGIGPATARKLEPCLIFPE